MKEFIGRNRSQGLTGEKETKKEEEKERRFSIFSFSSMFVYE
jgi:hypothetical protein